MQLVPGTSLHNGGSGPLAVHYSCTNAVPVPAVVGAYVKVLIAYPLVVAVLMALAYRVLEPGLPVTPELQAVSHTLLG